MLGAVALVLFIACANLASLMMARASGREREFAVRAALGAGRRRLAQQLLTEIAVLAAAGGAAGLALAAIVIRASNALVPAQLTAFGLGAAVNPRVALWCLGATLVAVFLVGLLPVFQTRADPNESLKRDGRSTSASLAARRARQGLIVAEVALAVMLALGAGLLLRSFHNLQRVDTGVDASAVITMRLTLAARKVPDGRGDHCVLRRARAAGRSAAQRAGARASRRSFLRREFFRTRVLVDGMVNPKNDLADGVRSTVASGGYFDAVGMTRRAGCTFDDRDRAGSPRVVVVNEAFVSRYLGGRAPLGARIPHRRQTGPGQRPRNSIGVVANTANAGAASTPAPEVFVPIHQRPRTISCSWSRRLQAIPHPRSRR